MGTTCKRACLVLLASAFICLFAAAGRAEDFSFVDTFTRDDEVRLFDFTVAASSSSSVVTNRPLASREISEPSMLELHVLLARG